MALNSIDAASSCIHLSLERLKAWGICILFYRRCWEKLTALSGGYPKQVQVQIFGAAGYCFREDFGVILFSFNLFLASMYLFLRWSKHFFFCTLAMANYSSVRLLFSGPRKANKVKIFLFSYVPRYRRYDKRKKDYIRGAHREWRFADVQALKFKLTNFPDYKFTIRFAFQLRQSCTQLWTFPLAVVNSSRDRFDRARKPPTPTSSIYQCAVFLLKGRLKFVQALRRQHLTASAAAAGQVSWLASSLLWARLAVGNRTWVARNTLIHSRFHLSLIQ